MWGRRWIGGCGCSSDCESEEWMALGSVWRRLRLPLGLRLGCSRHAPERGSPGAGCGYHGGYLVGRSSIEGLVWEEGTKM